MSTDINVRRAGADERAVLTPVLSGDDLRKFAAG
jgi:hypothetical protein